MKECFDGKAIVQQIRGIKNPNGTWDVKIDVIVPDGAKETYRFFTATLSPALAAKPVKVKIPANTVIIIPMTYLMVLETSFINLVSSMVVEIPLTTASSPQQNKSGQISFSIK